MKVLFAEDELTSRIILSAMLRKWGLEPVVVENGEQAWDLLQQPEAPQLVILDWNMPGLNGLEVCRKIRGELTDNPPYVIILTGNRDKQDIVTGLDSGANDYVLKPYDKDELHARIRVGLRVIGLQNDLLAAQRALSYDAMHDALTGSLNRRAIIAALEKELARADRGLSRLSIGLIDIDHFKTVNDIHGHQTGDDVLRQTVELVQGSLRSYDLIGRYGGEEFLVIAPETMAAGETTLYERLRSHIETAPFVSRANQPLRISVSIGVVACNGQDSVDELLAKADAALYQAKDGGRNRVVYHHGN